MDKTLTTKQNYLELLHKKPIRSIIRAAFRDEPTKLEAAESLGIKPQLMILWCKQLGLTDLIRVYNKKGKE